jgi:predicted DNA-binding transcriptional regulator YafY
MYHPTTRLLTILELLQSRALLTGDELARRLDVEPRTVRRYVTMLQDMGIPIETSRGPGGGYQLRPGFKLPPLMFSEEEATAITLGLLGISWLALKLPALAVEGALAKMTRVLPAQARERLQAVTDHLTLSPHGQESRPDANLLINLSMAIQGQQRVAMTYRSARDEVTQRTVEPYGTAGWWGRWYLVAYCSLRQDYRTFRLDHIEQMQVLSETFVRNEGFDCELFIMEQIARTTPTWQIAVEFQVPLRTVQQQSHSLFGTLTETASGVLFQTQHGELSSVARFLCGLHLPFIIHQPPELRQEVLQLAEMMLRCATTVPNPAQVESP